MRCLEEQLQVTGYYCSVTQLCPTLCNSVDGSIPGFPVLHYLPELSQTYVHWVEDIIQSSHPLSSPFPAFKLSQCQDLFQWVSSMHQVAKDLELQPKIWIQSAPMNIQNWFPLGLTGLISLRSKGLLRVFSNTTVQKNQFFSAQPFLWSNSCIHI